MQVKNSSERSSKEMLVPQDLMTLSQRQFPRMQEIRRHLHKYPELSEHEFQTTNYLAERIQGLGCTPVLAEQGRGLWVDLGGDESALRVLIRGDIDALPIATSVETPYASSHPGVMHACGHDAHTAVVFGALAILKEILPSDVAIRVVFQPAEETSTGGIHMIKSGALHQVAAAIALHVDPKVKVGQFATRDHAFTAGCQLFEVDFMGQAGHGARPHLTGDTISAAASWLSLFYERLHRSHDAQDPVVGNVGSIHGGQAANVVPEQVSVSGTIRTLSAAGLAAAKLALGKISQATELTHPVQVKIKYSTHTPPVINDPSVIHPFRDVARSLVGASNVIDIPLPSMGAEDFAFFAEQVPAAMLRLGVAGSEIGHEPLHTPAFDIDETALSFGAAVLAGGAIAVHRSIASNSTREKPQ